MIDPKMLNSLIGFDKVWNNMKIPTYPPYNIKKTGENTYILELAVAGFSKSQLSVELKDDKLVISGISREDNDKEVEFIHNGLAARSFKREWVLADNIEVANAELINGILKVVLEAIVKSHETLKIEIKE